MSRLEKFDTVEAMVDEVLSDWTSMLVICNKFDRGDKSAGRKVRKELQNIKKNCDYMRKEILSRLRNTEVVDDYSDNTG